MCIKKIVLKCFRRVGGVVNITDSEGGPTATGMIPKGGTPEKPPKKSCRPSPHRLINGTSLNVDLKPHAKFHENLI